VRREGVLPPTGKRVVGAERGEEKQVVRTRRLLDRTKSRAKKKHRKFAVLDYRTLVGSLKGRKEDNYYLTEREEEIAPGEAARD